MHRQARNLDLNDLDFECPAVNEQVLRALETAREFPIRKKSFVRHERDLGWFSSVYLGEQPGARQQVMMWPLCFPLVTANEECACS